MTPDQIAAFLEGSGGFLSAGALLLAIQACGAMAVFSFVAWLCVRAYNEYGEGDLESKDVLIVWGRGVLVMLVILYLILPEANIIN